MASVLEHRWSKTEIHDLIQVLLNECAKEAPSPNGNLYNGGLGAYYLLYEFSQLDRSVPHASSNRSSSSTPTTADATGATDATDATDATTVNNDLTLQPSTSVDESVATGTGSGTGSTTGSCKAPSVPTSMSRRRRRTPLTSTAGTSNTATSTSRTSIYRQKRPLQHAQDGARIAISNLPYSSPATPNTLLTNGWIGAHVLNAICDHRLGHVQRSKETVKRIYQRLVQPQPSSSTPSSRQPDHSVLGGRAGLLQLAWFLRQELQVPRLFQKLVVSTVVDMVKQGKCTVSLHDKEVPVLLFANADKMQYLLGAARGMIGVLHALLGCSPSDWKLIDAQLNPEDTMDYDSDLGIGRAYIRNTLDYLLQHCRFPQTNNIRPFVHVPGQPTSTTSAKKEDHLDPYKMDWYSGAAGWITLLLRASQVFQEPRFVKEAHHLCETVLWTPGRPSQQQQQHDRSGAEQDTLYDLEYHHWNMERGVGLAHGCSATALCFLQLSYHCPEPYHLLWHRRAEFTVKWALQHWQWYLDHERENASKWNTYGLYEGLGGLVGVLMRLYQDEANLQGGTWQMPLFPSGHAYPDHATIKLDPLDLPDLVEPPQDTDSESVNTEQDKEVVSETEDGATEPKQEKVEAPIETPHPVPPSPLVVPVPPPTSKFGYTGPTPTPPSTVDRKKIHYSAREGNSLFWSLQAESNIGDSGEYKPALVETPTADDVRRNLAAAEGEVPTDSNDKPKPNQSIFVQRTSEGSEGNNISKSDSVVRSKTRSGSKKSTSSSRETSKPTTGPRVRLTKAAQLRLEAAKKQEKTPKAIDKTYPRRRATNPTLSVRSRTPAEYTVRRPAIQPRQSRGESTRQSASPESIDPATMSSNDVKPTVRAISTTKRSSKQAKSTTGTRMKSKDTRKELEAEKRRKVQEKIKEREAKATKRQAEQRAKREQLLRQQAEERETLAKVRESRQQLDEMSRPKSARRQRIPSAADAHQQAGAEARKEKLKLAAVEQERRQRIVDEHHAKSLARRLEQIQANHEDSSEDSPSKDISSSVLPKVTEEETIKSSLPPLDTTRPSSTGPDKTSPSPSGLWLGISPGDTLDGLNLLDKNVAASKFSFEPELEAILDGLPEKAPAHANMQQVSPAKLPVARETHEGATFKADDQEIVQSKQSSDANLPLNESIVGEATCEKGMKMDDSLPNAVVQGGVPGPAFPEDVFDGFEALACEADSYVASHTTLDMSQPVTSISNLFMEVDGILSPKEQNESARSHTSNSAPRIGVPSEALGANGVVSTPTLEKSPLKDANHDVVPFFGDVQETRKEHVELIPNQNIADTSQVDITRLVRETCSSALVGNREKLEPTAEVHLEAIETPTNKSRDVSLRDDAVVPISSESREAPLLDTETIIKFRENEVNEVVIEAERLESQHFREEKEKVATQAAVASESEDSDLVQETEDTDGDAEAPVASNFSVESKVEASLKDTLTQVQRAPKAELVEIAEDVTEPTSDVRSDLHSMADEGTDQFPSNQAITPRTTDIMDREREAGHTMVPELTEALSHESEVEGMSALEDMFAEAEGLLQSELAEVVGDTDVEAESEKEELFEDVKNMASDTKGLTSNECDISVTPSNHTTPMAPADLSEPQQAVSVDKSGSDCAGESVEEAAIVANILEGEERTEDQSENPRLLSGLMGTGDRIGQSELSKAIDDVMTKTSTDLSGIPSPGPLKNEAKSVEAGVAEVHPDVGNSAELKWEGSESAEASRSETSSSLCDPVSNEERQTQLTGEAGSSSLLGTKARLGATDGISVQSDGAISASGPEFCSNLKTGVPEGKDITGESTAQSTLDVSESSEINTVSTMMAFEDISKRNHMPEVGASEAALTPKKGQDLGTDDSQESEVAGMSALQGMFAAVEGLLESQLAEITKEDDHANNADTMKDTRLETLYHHTMMFDKALPECTDAEQTPVVEEEVDSLLAFSPDAVPDLEAKDSQEHNIEGIAALSNLFVASEGLLESEMAEVSKPSDTLPKSPLTPMRHVGEDLGLPGVGAASTIMDEEDPAMDVHAMEEVGSTVTASGILPAMETNGSGESEIEGIATLSKLFAAAEGLLESEVSELPGSPPTTSKSETFYSTVPEEDATSSIHDAPASEVLKEAETSLPPEPHVLPDLVRDESQESDVEGMAALQHMFVAAEGLLEWQLAEATREEVVAKPSADWSDSIPNATMDDDCETSPLVPASIASPITEKVVGAENGSTSVEGPDLVTDESHESDFDGFSDLKDAFAMAEGILESQISEVREGRTEMAFDKSSEASNVGRVEASVSETESHHDVNTYDQTPSSTPMKEAPSFEEEGGTTDDSKLAPIATPVASQETASDDEIEGLSALQDLFADAEGKLKAELDEFEGSGVTDTYVKRGSVSPGFMNRLSSYDIFSDVPVSKVTRRRKRSGVPELSPPNSPRFHENREHDHDKSKED